MSEVEEEIKDVEESGLDSVEEMEKSGELEEIVNNTFDETMNEIFGNDTTVDSLDSIDKEVVDDMVEGGVTDESIKSMVDNIDWNKVNYEDPEQYIPVFSVEEYEVLDKLGELSPKQYLEMSLDMLREKVRSINTEDFQLMSEDEKRKEIDSIIETRNQCIGIVQESVRHYKEIMSKENISQLDGFILATILQKAVSKGSDSSEKFDSYKSGIVTLLLDKQAESMSSRNFFSGGSIGMVCSALSSYTRYEMKLRNGTVVDKIFNEARDKINDRFSFLFLIAQSAMDKYKESSGPIPEYIKVMGLGDRLAFLGEKIKEFVEYYNNTFCSLFEKGGSLANEYEDLKDKCLEYMNKVIDKFNRKGLDHLTFDDAINVQSADFYGNRIGWNPVIRPAHVLLNDMISDSVNIIVGSVFNEANGLGIEKNFTISAMAQFFYILALIRKYILTTDVTEENFDKKLVDIIDSESVKKDISVVAESEDFVESMKGLIFHEETLKSYYSHMLEYVIKVVEVGIENMKTIVECKEPGDDYMSQVSYGSIYLKIMNNTQKGEKRTGNKKKKNKKR